MSSRFHHRAAPSTRRRAPARLKLEMLEDRLVPSTFNVNTLADTVAVNLVTGQDTNGNVSLRSATQAANATPGGNTINLTLPGTYKITLLGTQGETDGAAGELVILPSGGDLTIQNTSTGVVTVDGAYHNRVFDINPNFDPANPTAKFLVTLQGFTVQHGVAIDPNNTDGPNASGGGIRDIGNASLTLTNMTVTNNLASADGGGVVMENLVSVPWTLTVNNSIISSNHAGDAGGGLDVDGTGKVFINNTVITGNTSVNQGAGIWLDAITQGQVFNVTLLTPGNGYTSAPTVMFTGGGGTGAAATAVITNGMVTAVNVISMGSGYATAPTISFTGGGGTGATAMANLFIGTANLTITQSAIRGNTAITGLGGGVGNAGNGVVSILNSTVAQNYSGATGGGFGDMNALGLLIVDNSFFEGNSAVGSGGGIAAGGITTTISFSEIKGNTSGGSGGGIFANGLTLSINGATVAGNTTFNSGGGIEVETTGVQDNISTITNTTIVGNSALNAGTGSIGGGIDAGNAGAFTGQLTLVNDTINANYAYSGGGVATANPAGTVNVQNTIIAGNVVTNAGPDYVLSNGAAFTSLGGNLIGINNVDNSFTLATDINGNSLQPLDPKLGPLGNNGGFTVGANFDFPIKQETEALLPGSPALGKGLLAGAPGMDGRDFFRVVNGTIDIGAVEYQYNLMLAGQVNPHVAVNGTLTYTLTLSNNGPDAVIGAILTDVLPANTTFVSFTAPAGWTVTAPAAGQTGTVTASDTNLLAAQTTASFTLVVHLTGLQAGKTLTNTPTAGPLGRDLNPGDNTATLLTVVNDPLLVTAPDAGGLPEVKVFDAITGALKLDIMAYDPRFVGGVRVALGDVNGDGTPDVITAPGPGGGPDIRVFDGNTGLLIEQFMAYDPIFIGGVYVAAGDVNGDGRADIITGADAGGGPQVRVFSGATGAVLESFYAYSPLFTGGVRVAAGDVNGDGKADIITAPGPGGGPDVEIFNGATGNRIGGFFAYDPHFAGGVYLAAGDVNGDGLADIITAPGFGALPEVKVFSGANTNVVLDDFFAYDQRFIGGVRVGFVGDINGDGKGDIVTAPGPFGGPDIREFSGATAAQLNEFFAYNPSFTGGVFVGGSGG